MGAALVQRLAERGHHVIVGSRSAERAVNAAGLAAALTQSGAPVQGARNPDAVRHAEVVLLTVPAPGQRDVLREIGPHCGGRVVVDTCVCHHPVVPGLWVRPAEGSAALRVRRLLPRAAAVAATLHAVSSRTLLDPVRFPSGDVPVVADGAPARDAATHLLDEIGLPWLDAGGLEMAAALEHLAALLCALAERHGVPRPQARFLGLPHGAASVDAPVRAR
jgi:NADPH-dependent F420 reductase